MNSGAMVTGEPGKPQVQFCLAQAVFDNGKNGVFGI